MLIAVANNFLIPLAEPELSVMLTGVKLLHKQIREFHQTAPSDQVEGVTIGENEADLFSLTVTLIGPGRRVCIYCG